MACMNIIKMQTDAAINQIENVKSDLCPDLYPFELRRVMSSIIT
jgi:hypothetical protein